MSTGRVPFAEQRSSQTNEQVTSARRAASRCLRIGLLLPLLAAALSAAASAQMTLNASVSPHDVSYTGAVTYSASASGGDPYTTRYAFFRRRPGGTWIPSIYSPPWQSSGTYTWNPTQADVGTWETYVWAKDGNTPPSAGGGYGYAAGVNTMPVQIYGPPTVPGPTEVSCAYTSGDNCWVTGDFVVSVNPSSGGYGSLTYQICRSNDIQGWGGCDVHLTFSGGSSMWVTGSHLPADGYRRAYYFQAKDSAGAYSGWNSPRYVRVDRYSPAVSATDASDYWYSSRTPTLFANDNGGGSSANSGLQDVRYQWNSPLNGYCTNGTGTYSGVVLTAPPGDNVLYACARDNTGRVSQWSGRYRIAPIGLTGSITPSRGSYLGSFTYTANASGGTPSTYRYAFFRRRPGGTWIPDVTAPAWQTSSTFTWSPTLADIGTWETYIWVKDANTPASASGGYGYAAGYNTMPIEVVGKPTVPGGTTVACPYVAGEDCWVAGDFVASVTASSGGMGSLVYQICRSNDTTGWGGCDVTLTTNGGTSITVAAPHLAGDGYRRAYYFQSQDSAGALSGWNGPRFVRIDRYAPAVSATNASTQWFASRSATVSASDVTGSAGANSGVAALRYAWNAALGAGCTGGTATSSGATLQAPTGDNVLYLCARDNVGRVAQWSGQYRVSPPLTLTSCSVSPARGSYMTAFTSTATASGGVPSSTQYAFFRRRPGGTWIPDVNAPAWQASSTSTRYYTASEVGIWETYVWAKDGVTPNNQNGYAAGCNSGPIEVVGAPTVPGPTTVACAYTSGGDCWVPGDFTASAAASTGGMGGINYQICRSNDTAGLGGCEVNLTLTGGTSIVVSGTHLAGDGSKRAYYFQAKDSSGALSGWNVPAQVRIDRYAPTVSASNASDTAWFSYRTATIAVADATVSAAANSGVAVVRYNWNAALDAACTTGTATAAGATLTAPAGDNVLYLCARDNTSRVSQWSGRYRVATMALTGTISPQRASYVSTFTYTANATGGTPSTYRYAFFRRRPGGTWIPDVNSPTWYTSNVFTWAPTQADTGAWETYIWVKDADTPASASNGYGYAAGYNTMPIEVVGPPTVPGPTTTTCAFSAAGDCWLTGDFTISAAASSGGMGGTTYQICRSNDTTGAGGCDVNLTLSGGTSILVNGTHLPADAYRRAYYFQAKDSSGALSGWNTPLYARVDRYTPAVSASNASDQWFSSRTATVSAADATTSAAANAGLAVVRYSWNTALDAGCTTGTVTANGATLTASTGDNLLYLCARDNVGRVAQWNGRYRVAGPMTLTVTPSPARSSYLNTLTWTATASGGVPGTYQYVLVRRRLPDGVWLPTSLSGAWQTSNILSWTPTQADAASWQVFVMVKDSLTPADPGYAATANPGQVEIVGPPAVPGPTTLACDFAAPSGDCWVNGESDVTASVTPSTGGMGSLVYQICRSNDSPGGFAGCEVNLTLNGGTSIVIPTNDQPANGFRRAYYFQAKDAAGALSGWNTPAYLRVDRNPPEVSATNSSDEWFTSRTATVTAVDQDGGVAVNSGIGELRYKWNPAPGEYVCTTGTAVASGATLTAPVGDNLLVLCTVDRVGWNAEWSGRYRVAESIALTGTVTPRRGSYLGPFTYTATATGGDVATRRFAFFRRRPGEVWIPDVQAPNWQASNQFVWQPTADDAGTWETYIWVKDGNTPASASNGNGYATGFNTMPIEVVGKPTVPGPTTAACAWTTGDDCWVQGDFTASVTPSTGGMDALVYQVCRSNDSPGGFAGCEANLTLTGGTSIVVAGSDLPGAGNRRAYYFQAKDSAGALSGWNAPRYVRVDRTPPSVSASNASDEWFETRTATVSASDDGGAGAAANSGLQDVRYSWNTELDAACTTGAVTAAGVELSVPGGDNVLYLCARDNSGRVMHWNGTYRVGSAPQVTAVTPFLIHQGSESLVTVTGAHLEGASVYVATQPQDSEEPATAPGVFPTAEVIEFSEDGTWLTVRVDARAAGIAGFFNLAVVTPGGKTAGQFRVVGNAPVVDVFSPSEPVTGSVHLLTIAGANLLGAQVVPLTPEVKVLDLDNSDDNSLIGLLYVNSDGPVGPSEIRIENASGEAVVLALNVVGSLGATTLGTKKMEIPGKSRRLGVPDVLMQEPVSPLLGGGPAHGGLFSGGGAAPMDDKAVNFCFFVQQSQRWQRSAILLELTDLGGDPLTQAVLNQLLPGQRLNFHSRTLAVSVWLQYEFLFKVCKNWVTVVAICAHGGYQYMVPFVGGLRVQFDYCRGTEGPKWNLEAEGFISRHEWSSTSSCVKVLDTNPQSESGDRYGTIDMSCCTPAKIHLRTTGVAFNTNFDAEGEVAEVNNPDCEEPEVPPAPELRVFLDVHGDNVRVDAEGKPLADHLYLPEELDDSGGYLSCSSDVGTGPPPGNGVTPSQLPQRTSLIAAYVQNVSGKWKIVPPPAGVTTVDISLEGTSTLLGVATNYPADSSGGPGSGFQDPDFWVAALGDTNRGGQTVTVRFGTEAAPSVLASANLYCNDYGGTTAATVRVTDGPPSPPLRIPRLPSFGSDNRRLPEIGWKAHDGTIVGMGSLQDRTDEDSGPSGNNNVGDGLSALSEYRGIVINGNHYRLNPGKKDAFIEWDADFQSLGGADAPAPSGLGLQLHRPRAGDMYTDADGTLAMNLHSVGIGVDSAYVVAVLLIDDPSGFPAQPPRNLGVTTNKVARRTLVTSTIYSNRIQSTAGNHLPTAALRNWVLAHELGHAVDICHREEDQNGQPTGPACDDGETIDPMAVIPNDVHFMHSGTIFDKIKNSSNNFARAADSYHGNSIAQIKLK
jgi:hypothetical protein